MLNARLSMGSFEKKFNIEWNGVEIECFDFQRLFFFRLENNCKSQNSFLCLIRTDRQVCIVTRVGYWVKLPNFLEQIHTRLHCWHLNRSLYIELFSSHVSSHFVLLFCQLFELLLKSVNGSDTYNNVRNCVILNSNKTENTNKFTAHKMLVCAVFFSHFAILHYIVRCC